MAAKRVGSARRDGARLRLCERSLFRWVCGRGRAKFLPRIKAKITVRLAVHRDAAQTRDSGAARARTRAHVRGRDIRGGALLRGQQQRQGRARDHLGYQPACAWAAFDVAKSA